MSRLEMSVKEKTLFHKEYYGPDCRISEAILELMGRKNFMKQQLNLLQEAGGKVTINKTRENEGYAIPSGG